ncbi:hypothetical protein VCRA2119O147_1810005 [Vibrio crassostreae]|nr:hypothetical protein VCHA29O37_610001 [Vibrio chagasii]CAK1811334.1 hypothetical protein VCRA2112O187_150027 [Vibrio crassostreae]CAK1942541.1 hypothetical protein VCRA2113O207_290017 [Vibrio crassostreae]CAK1944089.1 hypothetical protein VCRA2118O239_260007 [Vibrio crassostreae]CAK1953297.1 hypothetical protein VCRA2110O173_290040 [Vibrio crassostreae]
MVLPLSVLERHEEKLGKAGLKRLMRFLNAFFESLHPCPNPVGKHIQIPHSASLAALTCEL